MEDSAARSPRRAGVRVTDRDRLALAFIAEHRLVLPEHVEALLGVSANAAIRRLRALAADGLLSTATRFHRHPACFQVTRRGLALIESALPTPQLDYRSYAHDVGVAWLWLAARAGAFGRLVQVVSEREMRSLDGSERHAAIARGAPPARAPFGVPLSGYGTGQQLRLHYPDLLMIDPRGRRIAVELELTPKGRGRREKIIGGFAADARVDTVLYLVADARVGRAVRETAQRFGFEPRLQVQRVRFGAGQLPGAGRAAERSADREPRLDPMQRSRGEQSSGHAL